MNISIVGRHFDVTEPIRSYIEDKVNAVLGGKNVVVTGANVIIELNKSRFTSEVVLMSKLHVLEAKAEEFDFTKSFEAVIDKLEAQFDKLKDKLHDHHTKPLRENLEA